MKRLLALVLGCSLLLSGCAIKPPITLDPEITSALLSRQELTETPFIIQEDYQCGPASLAMIFQYYGDSTSAEALSAKVFTPDAKGSFPTEMDAISRQQGYLSYPINSLETIIQEIAAGHPVLVLQNLGISWLPKWHFAVIVGYDLKEKILILRSGELKRRITSFRLFETTWARSGHWARVLLPPTQLPVTAEPLKYLRAALDLKETADQEQTLTALQTAALAWPDQALVLLTLANHQYDLAHFKDANNSFLNLLSHFPDYSVGWNNFAYNLKAQGCDSEAYEAARCAFRLEPEAPNSKATLREMESDTVSEKPHCQRLVQCPRNF